MAACALSQSLACNTVVREPLDLIQAFEIKKIASEILATLTHFVFNQAIGKGKGPKRVCSIYLQELELGIESEGSI